MKKVVLLSIALLAITGVYAQKKVSKFNYRVGLVTSLPTDNDIPQTTITLGSTLGEMSYKVSKKISATANVGYTRYEDKDNIQFAQIPVTLGARYHIDQQFYFGANAGIAPYNKSALGTDFIYSPYVGMQIKKISIDARYMNTVRPEPIKVICLVFSYTL